MKIPNKRAFFDYEILSKLQVGIVLLGSEVKSAKLGHVSLKESYVKMVDGGLSLINATISPYKFANNTEYDPKRSRALLYHKKELAHIVKKMEGTNLTLVPTAMYTLGRRMKLEIAIARGKKEFQKKEQLKNRDLEREQNKTFKSLR